MFKPVLFVSLCIFMVVECQPIKDDDVLDPENIRVERDTDRMQNAMHMAGQIAQGGLEVANKGVHILSSAAKKAVSAGSTIAAGATKLAARSALTLL